MKQLKLFSNSSIQTMEISKVFAKYLHCGDTVVLTGELGARKN